MPPQALLYDKVAEKIGALIRRGVLRPGDRVPSLRRTSRQHGVSLATASQAYITLENLGLIQARPKSGFFVRYQEKLQEPELSKPPVSAGPVGMSDIVSRVFSAAMNPRIVPFGAAYPSAELLPVLKLNRTLAAISRSMGGQSISYDMPPGCGALRREIARRALDSGVTLSMDEIIITCGGTEALTLCLRAVTEPGGIVAVESPTYFGVLQTIESLGLLALEIPTHPRKGMDLDVLEKSLKKNKVAACLATPNFHNPLGSLMPEDDKRRLVEMLAKKEIPLIEDDLNGELHFGPERPRAARAFDEKGMVLLCSSFSKTLAPGYRVGWTAPGRFHEKVKQLKFANTLATPTLPQLAIAEFVKNGGYDHHLRSLRRMYAGQVQRVSQAVTEHFPAGTRITRPAGGFVLWVELPGNADSLKLHAQALAGNISITPGPMFSAKNYFRNFVRISCGHPWSPRMEEGIVTLGNFTRNLMK